MFCVKFMGTKNNAHSVLIIQDRYVRPNYSLLVTGLLLSYCARFLQLGALLWGSTSTAGSESTSGTESTLAGEAVQSTEFLWYFVDILYFLTTINVIKVPTYLQVIDIMKNNVVVGVITLNDKNMQTLYIFCRGIYCAFR